MRYTTHSPHCTPPPERFKNRIQNEEIEKNEEEETKQKIFRNISMANK